MLNRFAIFTSTATFFLIIAGALVTSTGSGLAVPDWPLSFGRFFPEMTGGVFYEHGHRMIAGTVGILTAVLAAWLGLKEERRWMRGLGVTALAAVAAQATLGGITVLYRLPQWVSVSHAVLAQTFFCLTIAIAFFTSPDNSFPLPNRERMPEGQVREAKRLFFLSAAAADLVYIQLILGAALRHNGSNLFLNLHVSTAVLVLLAVSFLTAEIFRRHRSSKSLMGMVLFLDALLTVQAALGIVTAFPSLFPPVLSWAGRVAVVTGHVGTGALILGGSFLIALKSFQMLRQGRTAGAEAAEKPPYLSGPLALES